ncbi:hypothetical protein VTN77DRAFT_5656 [Rasamsonia byssochlamydoides]|uniref:uncharacterized protein n=1 Tax=Rasamsonia byssochlamydoides TaxID=89139 RepID=UPI0037446032
MASNPSSVFPSLHRKPRVTDAAVKESREAAIREAKQHVREVVRNDWSFDPPSSLFPSSLEPATSLSSTVAATTSSVPLTAGLQPEVLEWRLREYGSSESEPEGESGSAAAADGGQGASRDPYRFENSDVIKTSVRERRRRWRAELEDEMRWNPGLRFWIERRDAWTGAKKRRELRDSLKELQELQRRQSGDGAAAAAQFKDALSGTSSSQGQQYSSSADGEGHRSNVATDAGPKTTHQREETSRGSSPSVPSPNELLEELSLSKDSDHDEGDQDDYDSDESLIPVVEPFLPKSNPVRSSITPAIYASIYSKVVVQGLTPTIPINLADVTKAIVQGWKADGQWPPKPTVPVPGSDIVTRKKGSASHAANHQNDNDKTHHNDETAAEGSKTTRKNSHSHGSGVTNAVKKVLGLSHHSFHLRRSSRGGSQAESEAAAAAAAARVSGETSITEVPVVEDGQTFR